METWSKTTTTVFTGSGQNMRIQLPPRWTLIIVTATYENSGNYAVNRILTPDNKKYDAQGRYAALGVAGGYGGLYSWPSDTELMVQSCNKEGNPVSGNYVWKITILGA